MGEGGLELGHLDGGVAQSGGLGGDAGGRRVVEGPEGRVVALGPVVESGDVGRPLHQPTGPVTGGQHHGGGTVGDRRDVMASEGLADVLLGQQGVDVTLPRARTATSAIERSSAMPEAITARAWRAANVSGSAPEGGQEVRVHLHGIDQGRIAGRGAAGSGDHGDLDVALLQAEPRFVEGPGAVHLHVGVPLGRPGADGVQVGDEGEGLAGDVVAAAQAREVDVGAGEPERRRWRR